MIQIKPTGIHLDFGRFAGTNICDVPEWYLRWVVTEFEAAEDEPHRLVWEAAREELDQRVHRGVGTFDFGGEA